MKCGTIKEYLIVFQDIFKMTAYSLNYSKKAMEQIIETVYHNRMEILKKGCFLSL